MSDIEGVGVLEEARERELRLNAGRMLENIRTAIIKVRTFDFTQYHVRTAWARSHATGEIGAIKLYQLGAFKVHREEIERGSDVMP